MQPGTNTILEEDSQNYILEKVDDEENQLYDLIEYEESEPLPEDEDGMQLHFQDEYYEEDNNYYSGIENTKKHAQEEDYDDLMIQGRRGGSRTSFSAKSENNYKRNGEKEKGQGFHRFAKFDKIKARMEELEMRRRDKHRDFVKLEGANFLGAVKFYNPSIEPHIPLINN